MPQPWSDEAVQHLLDTSTCPRCGSGAIEAQVCGNCGADLGSPVASELWLASIAAADALRARQALLDRVPSREAARVPSGLASASAPGSVAPPPPFADARLAGPAPGSTPTAAPTPTAASTSSQVTVQSVLALAGAGLFAIAAIVFTFFNPELTDFATRTTIIAVTTVLFLAGAWMLARRKLQFSAEAVGALGMVFLALDVWAWSSRAPDGTSGWEFAAIGTLVSAGIMLAVSLAARIRTWLWLGLLGVAIVPAFFGYAVGTELSHLVGHLAVGFAALGLAEVARLVAARAGSPLLADRTALTLLRLLVVIVVLAELGTLPAAPTLTMMWLRAAAVIAGLAVLAAASARQQLGRLWAFGAGAFVTVAVAMLPLALDLHDGSWYLALAPAAAGLAMIALAVAPARAGLPRGFLLSGALTVAVIATIPAGVTALVQIFGPAVALLRNGSEHGNTIAQTLQAHPESAIVGAAAGAGTFLGITASALAGWAVSRLARRATPPGPSWAYGVLLLSAWAGVVAVLVLTGWTGLARPWQVLIALAITLALVVLLRRVKAVAGAPLGLRAPMIAAIHGLPLLAGVISWSDSNVTVVGGAAIVAVLVAVARVVPAVLRPVYVGVGYAYALIVFATGLVTIPDLLGLPDIATIAVLCLTTTLGGLAALAATLTRWLSVRSWYAVLIVTSVPFLIGVASVVAERTGWTALSTGVIFALALALMLTRRVGTTLALRAGAAALLVPSLAVVLISFAPQVLEVSASPIVLPVIAAIVACVLPSTGLIGGALESHGIASDQARASRIAIEAGSLVTGAMAVVLALSRVAAGFGTSFLVLVIIGVGSLATAIWGGRRYAWWVAGASFTGALWCVWARQHVGLVEAYLLPPALAAAIIGGILVLRGRKAGTALYASGLLVAAVPVVVILALTGSSVPGLDLVALAPWRAYGLLVASSLLLVLGSLHTRWPRRFAERAAPLAVPTLAVAIVAASAGALEAVRIGARIESFGDPELRMLPALAFSVAGAGLAALAAAQLHALPGGTRAGRWLYAPALVYLVLGPWSAIDRGLLAGWTEWGLLIGLLVLMVATTARARVASTTLPPVWFTFVLAFITAVVAWSPRQILRVEGYSLPLGLMLLAAGVIAMLPAPKGREVGAGTGNSWPIGWTGSWRTLSPGLVVTFLASIVATGTEPAIWRAVTVISMALVAVLLGSVLKVAAPFVIGIIVLVVENIVEFASQIGHGVDSVPWWITLAVAGALLLIIAVTYERRDGRDGSIAARMRDLR